MVSCQNGPTRHAYAWQIGPLWQDTLEVQHRNLKKSIRTEVLNDTYQNVAPTPEFMLTLIPGFC